MFTIAAWRHCGLLLYAQICHSCSHQHGDHHFEKLFFSYMLNTVGNIICICFAWTVGFLGAATIHHQNCSFKLCRFLRESGASFISLDTFLRCMTNSERKQTKLLIVLVFLCLDKVGHFNMVVYGDNSHLEPASSGHSRNWSFWHLGFGYMCYLVTTLHISCSIKMFQIFKL